MSEIHPFSSKGDPEKEKSQPFAIVMRERECSITPVKANGKTMFIVFDEDEMPLEIIFRRASGK